jgi:hypothetical protein
MAVMLNNYAVKNGMALPVVREYAGFMDEADIANYAKEAAERLFRTTIIGGKPGNVFDPRGQATRAEFAALLQAFAEMELPDEDGLVRQFAGLISQHMAN